MLEQKNPIFWPTLKGEGKIFCLMSLIIFLTLTTTAFLRPLKDSYVIMTLGVQYIIYLKSLSIIPLILVALLYVKFFNVKNMLKIFHYIIGLFSIFFLFHAFILYPNSEIIQPSKKTIESLTESLPAISSYIKLYGMWVHALYFIVQDLWQIMMVSMIFWQFANFVSTVSQAKRHYPFYILLGGMGFGIGGGLIYLVMGDIFNLTMKIVSTIVALSGLLVGYLLNKISNEIALDKSFQNIPDNFIKEDEGFFFSLKEIFKSKYLWLIMGINFCLAYISNLSDLIWKGEMIGMISNAEEYTKITAKLLMNSGFASAVAIVIMIIFIRRVSWLKASMFVPISSILIAAIILVSAFLGASIDQILFVGSIYFILTKSIIRDMNCITRELSYIPLKTSILKGKGRAFLEILGIGLAKSFASLIPVSIFMISPSATVKDCLPAFTIFFVIIAILWMFWVCALGKEFKKLAPGE